MLTVEDAKALVDRAALEDVELLGSREWPWVQVNHLLRVRDYPPFKPREGFYEALALTVFTYVVEEEREDLLACLIAGARRRFIVFVPEAHEARLRARRLLAAVNAEAAEATFSNTV